MLACIGDLHLDKFNQKHPQLEDGIIECLKQTCYRLLSQEGIDVCVLMGDIFHTPNPSQNSMLKLLNCLTELVSEGITFYMLLGNHDTSNSNENSLKLIEWFGRQNKIHVVTEPIVVKTETTKLWLCPHPYVTKSPTKVDWSLGHFAVSGAKSDNGYVVKATNQPRGRWILGDFHTPQSGRVNSCIYTYVGSLTQLSWQEDYNKKRVILLNGNEKKSMKTWQPYELKEVTVEVASKLPACDEKNVFYRLVLKSGTSLPSGYLQKYPQILTVAYSKEHTNKISQVLLKNTKTNPLDHLEAYLNKNHPKVAERAMELASGLK
jgi:DNA repair exonuclease SbcCD nuclease subunit